MNTIIISFLATFYFAQIAWSYPFHQVFNDRIKIERRSCCDRAENRCRAFGAGGSSLNACVTYTCGGTCGSTNFMKRFFKSKNNALTKTEKMSAKKRSDCCLVSKNRCPGSFAQCQAFMNYSCGGCF